MRNLKAVEAVQSIRKWIYIFIISCSRSDVAGTYNDSGRSIATCVALNPWLVDTAIFKETI